MAWTADDIPPQASRIAVVTGATSGLGHHTALQLARAGAEVVLAVRDVARGVASKAAHDEAAARRLWEVSEELTGVRYL